MNPLPHPPAEPLHIVPPWLPGVLLLGLLAALGLLLLGSLGWWYWRRREQRRTQLPQAIPASAGGPAGLSFAEQVDGIVSNHCEHYTAREGCHALARLVRQRLERLTGLDMEEMTVTEMSGRLDEKKIEAHLLKLQRHQFDRKPPRRKHLRRLGTQCKQVLARRRSLRLGSRE